MEKYFLDKTGRELINELEKKVTDYDEFLTTSGLMSELKKSYSLFNCDTTIRDIGKDGEYKAFSINQYASLCRNIVSIVCANKPAFTAVAANSDSASIASATLATSLLDYYAKQADLAKMFRDAVQISTYLRESWLSVTWDSSLGSPVAVDNETGEVIKEGDLKFNIHLLPDIIRDVTRRDAKNNWIIVREYKSRFEMMAKYPEKAEKISSIQNEESDIVSLTSLNSVNRFDRSSELIPVYTLYHTKNILQSEGRVIEFVKGEILMDAPMPYDSIPVLRLCGEELIGTPFGHSQLFDLLPLQAAVNTMASTILTNNQAYGVQSILVPKAAGINVKSLSSGLNIVEYNSNGGGKPEPLSLIASQPEAYNFLNTLQNTMQTLSGVSDVLRGSLPSSGMSGSALSLLASQSLQYVNGLAQAYSSVIEAVGNLSIQILKQFAHSPRIAILVGKTQQSYLKEWKSADLQSVSYITVEQGNALSKSTAGKISIAQDLLQSGLIKRPEQYLQLISAGTLTPIYENETSQLTLIKKENEWLSEGKAVRAIILDSHVDHIKEHSAVLNDPDLRFTDSAIVQHTIEHIQSHIDLLQKQNPILAQILGQPPVQQQFPANGTQTVTNPESSIETEAGNVNQPNMPIEPLSGERFQQ